MSSPWRSNAPRLSGAAALAAAEEGKVYNKLLAPIDESGPVGALLPHVVELATTFGSQVILLQ